MLDALMSRAKSQGLPWQTLLKETLQVFFLESFYAFPEGSQATFQGGTSLKLLHGAPRHSEDLDFVTLKPLESWDKLREPVFKKLKSQEALLQGTLELTAQKPHPKILRWKLKWQPYGEREKVFVRIELARYPAHTRELLPLTRPPGLPSGSWVVIPVETREEILADKLAAIAGRPYLKGRDFFDLWFLHSREIGLDRNLIKEKLKDYNVSTDGLKRGLEITKEVLERDLKPFLPGAIRRPLEAEGYRSILKVSGQLLNEAADIAT